MANLGNDNVPSMFERFRPMLGFFLGAAVLCGAMFGAYVFWQVVSKRAIVNAEDFVFAAAGFFFVLAVMYFGARIVISTIGSKKDVIPREDRELLTPLISGGNEKAIDLYVRLSSLTGATGTATKLGLTGLPLVTVGLTLIFCVLEIYKPSGGFMDLAKLTLGAFIGSFVQRVATTQEVVSAASARTSNGSDIASRSSRV
jgi:hypothetical protein